jgi:hypothetical protein
MKISDYREGHLREQVREIIALNPMVTIRGLQRILQHNTGHSISDKYAARLLRKVHRTAVVQADHQKLSSRILEVRERNIALRNQLYRIAYWTPQNFSLYGIPKPKSSERINAIRTIAQLDLALLKAELDVGMYENRQAAIGEVLREGLLPQEVHEEVVAVFRRHRLVPMPTEMVRSAALATA